MKRLFILATAACLLSACATSPTGRTQFMLISPEAAIVESRTAYLSTVSDLDKQDKLSSDKALAKRVATITGRLVTVAMQEYPRSADWEWSVAVIDDPDTVNAWCMAGGRMAVYTGLFEQLKLTDAEFAQIMGHEISHALANHTAELEADHLGMEIAVRAGYDPDAAVTLWEKMGSVGGDERPPEFLSTHPAPGNRQAALGAMANDMRQLNPTGDKAKIQPIQVLTADAQ